MRSAEMSKDNLAALVAFTDAAYRCSFRKVMPPEVAAIVDSLREAYEAQAEEIERLRVQNETAKLGGLYRC